MADFSMCQDIQCPDAKRCKRSIVTTKASEWQSFMDFKREHGMVHCAYFWDTATYEPRVEK